MAKQMKSWRRFSLRTLLVATFTAAVFFAGYRLGYHDGRDALMDRLIKLITTTIRPETWEDVGGSGMIGPSFEIRCFAHADDSTDASNDPFAGSTNDPFAGSTNDPFASNTNDPFAGSTDDPFAGNTNDPFASNRAIESQLGDDPFK